MKLLSLLLIPSNFFILFLGSWARDHHAQDQDQAGPEACEVLFSGTGSYSFHLKKPSWIMLDTSLHFRDHDWIGPFCSNWSELLCPNLRLWLCQCHRLHWAVATLKVPLQLAGFHTSDVFEEKCGTVVFLNSQPLMAAVCLIRIKCLHKYT